ncbi:MAG TPA: ribosome maturation factor RimP [Firmicutes bacterium]|nr:ribosome maturation factor RimP [Bacillota bacterium]
MARDEIERKVSSLVEPVLHNYSLELVDLEYSSGRKGYLCIYIDKPGGATIGDCETVSREISDLLDMYDPIPHHYVLEVSTPGIERPLRKREDFRRFAGEAVKVYTDCPVNGRRKFIGILTGAGDEMFTLTLEEGDEVELGYDQVTRAHLWYRPTGGTKK